MKKLSVLLLALMLISCGKSEKQGDDDTPEAEFKDGFVAATTYYYKKPVLKGGTNYKGTLKRGQKISVVDDEVMKTKQGVKHFFQKCKLPGADGVYWVKSKYIYKSGFENRLVYANPLKIATVNKEASHYKLKDINSSNKQIKAGVKVFIIEEKTEWSKVNIIVRRRPLLVGNRWMKNADLAMKENANVDFKMKDFISKIGNIIYTSSSHYTGMVGTERLHSADMAFDGKKHTAWIEGDDGPGRGEWIKIEFVDGLKKFNLSIINGYAGSEKIYKANCRVKRIKVETDTDTKVVELKDNEMGYQYLGTFSGTFVKLTIDDIYEGKDSDTAISEIKILEGQGTPPQYDSVTPDEKKKETEGTKDSEAETSEPQN